MLPTAALLLYSQISSHARVTNALRGTVAGVVAMVPEGLVLLTSVAFAVGVVRLARRNTLVQELAAVETLARVDVICVDKTGTLTTGEISVDDVDHLQEQGENISALGALAAVDPNPNATLLAVREAWPVAPWDPQEVVPFSSARKWSAARFEDHGTWVIGAPEILLASIDETASTSIRRKVEAHATTGRRVLLLARSAPIVDESLQGAIEPRAIITLVDRMRPDAADTIAYFDARGWSSRSSPATIRARPPRSQGALASRMPTTPWMRATSRMTRRGSEKRSSATPCSAASLRTRREPWSRRCKRGARRRDDGRRCQRRAGPKGRRHRDRDGSRQFGIPRGGAIGAS